MNGDARFGTRPETVESRVPNLKSRTLADWLAYQEGLHPNTIDLGLERLGRVLERLQWRRPGCSIVTVGGTNGKGSCVALLESILSAGGYRVGTFTSPHLIRYNERIRIAGREVSDTSLVAAFERIEAARGDISLTFFEFNALAALLVFATAGLDSIILEVGLGGRLDAVNIVDADVALLSSVALDHRDWLGDDVESIGYQKAGIFREHNAAVLGSRKMPGSVTAEAQRIGARLLQLGAQFDYRSDGITWSWQGSDTMWDRLPLPALAGAVQLENGAAVLAALDCLRARLPLRPEAIRRGLLQVQLPGRFQRMQVINREWLLDVAHNPAAAANLARNLSSQPCSGRTLAVCGMFADKDAAGVVEAVSPQIDLWIVVGLVGARALAPEHLAAHIVSAGATVAHIAADVVSACEYVASLAQSADRIVVFGSFHTVGPALKWLGEHVEHETSHAG